MSKYVGITPKVSFVVLTWNSEKYIKNFFGSVSTLYPETKLEVIIIDNGSKDGSLLYLNQAKMEYNFPIEIISLSKNVGTTKSRNLGIRKSSGDFLVIMDSDVEFRSDGFRNMIRYLERHPEIGILAPKIVYPDGRIQHSCKKFPTFSAKLIKLLGVFIPHNFTHQDLYEDFTYDKCKEVDTAISAFWLMRKELIDLIGYLDENIFYAPEDVDFCVRVWLVGKKVMFYPYFEVIHHTQQITHKSPFDKISRSHLKGLFYYFKKYHYWMEYDKIRKLVDRKFVA